MKRIANAAAVLLVGILGGVCPLSAQNANIGRLTLSAPNFGYQTVGLYNFTGAAHGCEQYASQYNVCNAVNISSWQLTIAFAANAAGVPSSPLVFSSNGSGDVVGPTNASFDAYTGEAGNPWTLSFDLKNAGCSPSCDAKISSITFTGTLDTNTLQLYNGAVGGPYVLDSLGAQNFSVTWNIPSADYTVNPDLLFDSTDIVISNQTQLTSQTITFGPLTDEVLGSTPPALSATATSGLTVAFVSNDTSVCTVSGTAVTLVAAGTCSITASQSGNSTYAAATPVTQTFNVTQAPQTVTFGPLTTQTLGTTPPALTATASSGLTVTYLSNSPSVCTVSGTAITLVAGGTCSITASQTGNVTYAAATPVTQTFTVLASQTISFGPLSTQTLGTTPPALSATATSGLTVTFTSNSPSICTVSGTGVTLIAAGTCSITAGQAGNSTYAAAANVTQTFTVNPESQTITFTSPGTQTLGTAPPALSASSTSGLTVTFTSNSTSVCTVSGTSLTLVSGGTCSITANQGGNSTYAAAAPVTQTFTVNLTPQTISFGILNTEMLTSTPPALRATATSGLTVTFTSNSPLVCTVSGVNITLVAVGTCSITASQAGNATYAAATSVTQTFLVTTLTVQSITFGPIADQTLGTAPPAVSATASSGLTVTFTSNTAAVCTVSGTTLTLLSGGTCSITASQAGDSTYAPATPVTQTFTVNLTPQTIDFGTLNTETLTSTPPALSATATSGLPVTFTSNSPSVCTVSGVNITLVAVGTCSITASQAGDSTYAAASSVTETFLVSTLTAQSITFGPIATQALGTTPTPLTATATSGLTVTFTSNSTSVCTVSGVNITLITTGTCSITASQAGDSTYAAATPVTQTFTVSLTPQTISFGILNTEMLTSTPPALSATATSGLTVTFASNSPLVCTVSGVNITLVAVGTCSITASQAGNTTYAAAPSVTQTFLVTTLTAQSITFGPIADQTLGTAPFPLSATSTSGLTVTFTSNSASVCTVSGVNVTLLASGTCSITASQSGNGTYAAATPITQTFNVNKIAQTITFTSPGAQTLGTAPPALSASSTSGLTVTFTSNSASVCTVSGTSLTLVSGGTCSITANQGGNSTYAAAAPVTQTFTVNLTPQTISFGTLNTEMLTSTPPALSATATSGLTVTFTSNSPLVCTVSGANITLVAVGTCSITASQAGNATYAAATSVTQTFLVTTLTVQSITFGPIATHAFGTTPPTLTATATSGLTVTFASNSTAVCTVAGTAVTLAGVGTCSITASQPGNGTYAAASPITQTFAVTQGANTITFNAINAVTLPASPFGLIATASSGLTVSFASTTSAICTVSGTTVTPLTSGTCSITATQAGNANYAAATPVIQSFTINPVSSGGGGGGGGGGTPPTFTIAPKSLTFKYQQGNANLPVTQSISVFSDPSGASFTVVATSTGNWLSASTGSATSVSTPGSAAVSVNVTGLSPGTYDGSVTIMPGTSAAILVPVELVITAPAPALLAVAPTLETYSVAQAGAPVSGEITVSNEGGGTLTFTATVDQMWLSFPWSGGGSATPDLPASLAFTADPSGLKAGVYTGHISVKDVNSSAKSTVTVVLTVTKPAAQSIQLSRAGLSLVAVAGAPPEPQTFTVANSGAGSLNWTARTSTITGGNWLKVTPASGISVGGAAGTPVTVSASTTGLAAGRYYGSIDILAQNANNSPQTVSVLLDVLAAQPNHPVLLSSGGVILIGAAGSATPARRTVNLYNLASSPITYTASAFASGSVAWLSANPASGTLNPGANSIQITADLSALSPGVQRGNIRLSFSDGNTATIYVLLLVTRASPSSGAQAGGVLHAAVAGPRPLASATICAGGIPASLIPIFLQPVDQSSVQVAAATTVQVQVVDDCGNPVTVASGGSVQVTFNNGDQGINLTDTGSGIWEGTWTPTNASASTVLQVAASENGLVVNPALNLQTSITVNVLAAGSDSAPQPTGIANAASGGQATPQVVAPGSYIAIYGTGLAGNGNPAAPSLPLQTTLNGTQLLLGGIPMPLLYAAPGQINALVPQAIAPNATYPLVVVRGSTQSVPVPLTVTELQPGTYTVDTSGSGAGVVANALTGQLITASNPAHASDFLVVYSTGLGSVLGKNGEAQPADGVAAPTGTIYYTTAKLTATIGGIDAPVSFSGLTPTFAALGQINVQVPPGVPPGNAVPLVITATDATSGTTAVANSVTITVQ